MPNSRSLETAPTVHDAIFGLDLVSKSLHFIATDTFREAGDTFKDMCRHQFAAHTADAISEGRDKMLAAFAAAGVDPNDDEQTKLAVEGLDIGIEGLRLIADGEVEPAEGVSYDDAEMEFASVAQGELEKGITMLKLNAILGMLEAGAADESEGAGLSASQMPRLPAPSSDIN